MYKVKLTEFVNKMNLKSLLPDIDTDSIMIEQSAVNRLALQLAGFFEHFDSERIQVIGNVEAAYMKQLAPESIPPLCEKIFSFNIPCLVFCRGLEPSLEMLDTAELIHRGHRLVSDDVVEIRKISDDTLLGTSPDITRHFIELRGIGIVDVKTLFGVESVMYNQTIDMVIRLEDWNREANYDRLGLDEEYIEFLGNKVVCYSIPIRPGRNLAVIVESAAINYRAKKMGYNAAQELYNRVTGSLSTNKEEQKEQ